METRSVIFDDFKIEVEVYFVAGCPGDDQTAPTQDSYIQTGKYYLNDVDVSLGIKILNDAANGKIVDFFSEDINDN